MVNAAGRAGASRTTVDVRVEAIGAKLATTRVYKTCAAKTGADALATVLLKTTV